MDKLTLKVILILVVSAISLAWWGISYAQRIYKNPMLKTYTSVFRGVGIPLEAATAVTWLVLWEWGYFWELGGLVYIFWGAIGIPAIPMMILQEKKYREQIND